MKQRRAALFIMAADGSFVFESIVIWRSKVPRCFKLHKVGFSPPKKVIFICCNENPLKLIKMFFIHLKNILKAFNDFNKKHQKCMK